MSNLIQGVPAANPNYGATSMSAPDGNGNGGDFVKSLQQAMSKVSQLQTEADAHVSELLTGNSQDVHSAMIAVEKASLAFEMMVQVRNKIVQAYQQISGMQF
jgi:flagellar hook-basal body complex protein FliE